ncbi:BgTH12-00432 [Blumeria graminis f. sp. triticale]|uniref:BgTH12-00432 n=2 Tax=Blumeria graminis f. sp. triticale TaxID=1689686 RepID=A0A9W4D600_BLUGR|nr:BgTH12-00432 [Blumeria graminis f. sp. triticale]
MSSPNVKLSYCRIYSSGKDLPSPCQAL